MKDLPEGWGTATLEELAGPAGLVRDGDWVESKDQNQAGPIRLVQLADVGNGQFLDRSNRFMDVEASRRLNCTHLHPGDVLIARMPEPLGRACMLPDIGQEAVTVVDVMIWRPDPDLSAADGRWLVHALNSPDVREQIQLRSSGTTRIRIAGGRLKDLRLSIPPIEEQRRVAAKVDGLLDRLSAARTILSEVPDLLESYRRKTLSSAFREASGPKTRTDAFVENGRRVRLGDVVESFQYGTSAKSSREGSVPVLRMGNIQGGELDWGDLVFTSREDEIAKYRLLPGDVLFNRTNSPELVGKTAMFDGAREAIAAGYLIRIRCGPSLNPEYLTLLLNSPVGRAYCRTVKSDGVSQSNISASKLAAFSFELPPLDEQAEIVRRLKRSLAWIDDFFAEQAQATREIADLERTILQMAYRGTLVPRDATDRPIGRVLAEIEATRGDETTRARPAARTKRNTKMPAAVDDLNERLRSDSGLWPAEGLPFEEISNRLGAPYEGMREAIFALLSTTTPLLEQRFDHVSERIVIRRAAHAH